MKNIALIVLALLIVAGGAFFAGTKYQAGKNQSFFRSVSGQGQFRQMNRSGLRPVTGEIISSDDKSVTVKLQDGSSKIVLFSDKTTINKASKGTKEDLKTGENIAVFGQENTDGSVTAQSIQLGAMFRAGQPRQQN